MALPQQQPSGYAATVPIAIVSPQFCVPYTVDLSIVQKVMSISDGSFVVTDINGTVIFKVKGALLTLRDRRVLIDAAGNPLVTLRRKDAAGNAIVTLYKKKMSMHERWEVYKGENSDSNNLLFSVRESSMFQRTVKWDVFLANNSSEKVCDFRIKATQQACVIYAQKDEWIIAEMATVNNGFFEICVNPNIDYAFIVSLVIILDTIIKESVDHPISIGLGTGMVTGLATAAITGPGGGT
ncbi:hypothetical protein L6164_000154 [Bauhinia variegata]|uniref:Uncharacterized protein n=1 Tax=Bauhinia variegata TaxID=167791 RepID=A0ACB9Q5N1_BAUVA|nr:hypothetical protein L6164_000154 [Bauhinia variegata]